jgi:hypothetical protein
MMASRVVGYLLLAILVGAVLLSFVILGIQWVRSEDNKTATPTKTGYVIQYQAPVTAQVVYHSVNYEV